MASEASKLYLPKIFEFSRQNSTLKFKWDIFGDFQTLWSTNLLIFLYFLVFLDFKLTFMVGKFGFCH